METAHFRNMYDIHRGKIILLLAFIFSSLSLSAQVKPKGNYNFWEYRTKPFYFGLTLGMHTTSFYTTKSREFSRSDSLTSIQNQGKPGLNVNIITNLKIGQYFDFRFIPGFAFSERNFIFNDNYDIPIRIESVFLEVPMMLRFKSDPYKDKRLFVAAGLKYSYDVQSNSKARKNIAETLIKIAPHDFQFEVGAGMQLFFPFFIFSPEIKFSQGLSNINIYNGALENSRVIDKVLSRAFTISLHFEG